MPRFDGTGPWGYGHRTGWGLGPCGCGMAWGRGFGFWPRRSWSKKETLDALETEEKMLEQELKALREEKSELAGQK